MFIDAIKQLKIALYLLILFTLITGIIYPAIVTTIAQLLFPWQANGSFIYNKGATVGSLLIGQFFNDEAYFWSRPSATTPFAYNAQMSTGSNMGPSNPDFLKTVKARVDILHQADPLNTKAIPVDLVTASGSGLDPEISLQAAFYQMSRIAKVRNLSENDLLLLISELAQRHSIGFLGTPRVNVLQLNLALDEKYPRTSQQKGTL